MVEQSTITVRALWLNAQLHARVRARGWLNIQPVMTRVICPIRPMPRSLPSRYGNSGISDTPTNPHYLGQNGLPTNRTSVLLELSQTGSKWDILGQTKCPFLSAFAPLSGESHADAPVCCGWRWFVVSDSPEFAPFCNRKFVRVATIGACPDRTNAESPMPHARMPSRRPARSRLADKTDIRS